MTRITDIAVYTVLNVKFNAVGPFITTPVTPPVLLRHYPLGHKL